MHHDLSPSPPLDVYCNLDGLVTLGVGESQEMVTFCLETGFHHE